MAVPSVTVRVIERGRYNDPEHRCHGFSEVGDVITIAGGWYASSLIEQGMVSLLGSGLTERQQLELQLSALDEQIESKAGGGEDEGDAVATEPTVAPPQHTSRRRGTQKLKG